MRKHCISAMYRNRKRLTRKIPEIRLIILAIGGTQVRMLRMLNGIHDPVMYYYALRELNSQQPIRQFALPRPRITSAQEYGFF